MSDILENFSLDGVFIAALVLAVIGAPILYFEVFSKKKENSYTGIMKFLYDLVHFRFFLVEVILKITYIAISVFITIMGLASLVSGSFWLFILVVIAGNLGLRIGYEVIMMYITLVQNTNEINKKLGENKNNPPVYQKNPVQTPVQEPVQPEPLNNENTEASKPFPEKPNN
jgi:hypothetical protein